MSSYTINSIKGSVANVSFSCDGKAQDIGSLPLGDAVALDEALTAMAIAYENGLAIEAQEVPVDPQVKNMIGKPQTVKVAPVEEVEATPVAEPVIEPIVETPVENIVESPIEATPLTAS